MGAFDNAWSVLKLDRSHFNRLEIDDDDELSYEPTEEYPGQHRDEPVKNPMHEAAMDERFEEEEAEGVPEKSRLLSARPPQRLDLSTPKNPFQKSLNVSKRYVNEEEYNKRKLEQKIARLSSPWQRMLEGTPLHDGEVDMSEGGPHEELTSFQKSWNTLKARTERAYSPMHGESAPTAEQRAIDRSVAMKPDNLQTMTQLAGMPQDISSATGDMPRQTERANVMRDESRNRMAGQEELEMGMTEEEEADYVKYLLDRRKGENEARFRESAGSEGSPAGGNIGGLSSRVAL